VKVRWSVLALQRISEVVDSIAHDRPEGARRWAQDIFAAVEELAQFPDRGRIAPELGQPSVREIILGDYRILYKTGPKGIGVLTVRHGRRRFNRREVSTTATRRRSRRDRI
jgi:toxin ParE1/3/4